MVARERSFHIASAGSVRTYLERVVAVAGNAFVDREQEEVQSVLVLLVQLFQQVRHHRRVCVRAARRVPCVRGRHPARPIAADASRCGMSADATPRRAHVRRS